MKRILIIIAVLLTATILSGSGNKASVWKYELPLSFYGEFDSIPTINQFGQVRNGIIVDNIISVYNADPNGVDLTETQIEAFRMLVGGMYTTGTWQKCRAIYPFIGGSAYKHKWNIKDLRDLDAAFRLVFVGGGWVHNSLGSLPNGSTSYANTFLNANTYLNPLNHHFSFYTNTQSGTQNSSFKVDLGIYQTGGTTGNTLIADAYNLSGVRSYMRSNSNTTTIFSTPTGSINGLYINNRTSSTSFNFFIKGFKNIGATTAALNSLLSLNFYISAENSNNNPTNFSDKRVCFASIGSGLTDTEAIRLSNIVTQVQRHLGRQ